jgi:tetratricopeptide repeat protein 21B
MLCRQSRPSQAATTLVELIDSLDRHEPKNAALYYRIAQPFARLAGKSRQIIELTLSIIERARVIEPSNSLYVTEYGCVATRTRLAARQRLLLQGRCFMHALVIVCNRYQQALLGEFTAASESYRQASKLDESNVSALAGMIYCQICEGQYDDAEQQLDLFRMIQESVGRTAELVFLDALLAWCVCAVAADVSARCAAWMRVSLSFTCMVMVAPVA